MPEHLDHVEEGGILPQEQLNQRALGLMVEIVSALDGFRGSPDFQSWESSPGVQYRFTTPAFLYEHLVLERGRSPAHGTHAQEVSREWSARFL